MDVDLWRLFVQVAQHESITRVATTRGVAQSVVSRQLATVERLCGGRLFERTGRGVKLNEAGARIYPRVVAWLEESDQLARDVRMRVNAPSGTVRVGLLSSMSGDVASTLYLKVRAAYPDIRLRILDGAARQISEWMDEDRLDFGVMVRNPKEQRRGDIHLAALNSCLVGPANDALTRTKAVPFGALDDLPLVMAGPPNVARDLLEHLAGRRGIRISVPVECDSIPLQKHLVATSGVYAILGEHAIQEELRMRTLQAARIVSPDLVRSIVLSIPQTRAPTPACRAALEIARPVLAAFTTPTEP